MAVSKVTISGVDLVLKRLNAEIQGIQGRTKAGMRAAALLVKGRAMRLTPVATGHLKGSADTQVYDTSMGPAADVYYTAFYAPFVHEIDKNYRSPGTGWKFLERALSRSEKEIVEIIARTAKV